MAFPLLELYCRMLRYPGPSLIQCPGSPKLSFLKRSARSSAHIVLWMAIMPHDIYQIKVTLLGTKPPIWRSLLVPAAMTLARLHDALQMTMGWEDSHLHQYEIAGQRYGVPDPEMDFGDPTINEKTVHLSDVLGSAGAEAIYTYDFGDGWEHSILVEKLMKSEPGTAYPVCTGGKCHC